MILKKRQGQNLLFSGNEGGAKLFSFELACFELFLEKDPKERKERASDDEDDERPSSPSSRKLLTGWSLALLSVAPGAPEPERPFGFDDDLLNIGQGEATRRMSYQGGGLVNRSNLPFCSPERGL